MAFVCNDLIFYVGRADMYDADRADAACQEVASALREQVYLTQCIN